MTALLATNGAPTKMNKKNPYFMNPVTNVRDTQSAPIPQGLASERQTQILLALALAVLTFALYLPALHNGFVNYDDPDYVTRNGRVLQGLNWKT